MNSRSVPIIVGLVCLSAASAQAVDLKFGWKAGMSCDVAHTTQNLQGRRGAVTFKLTARAAPDDRLAIEVSDVKPMGSSLAAAAASLVFDASVMAALVMPNFEVDRAGSFARLQDADKSRAALRKVLELNAPKDSDPAKTQRVLELFGSEEVLESITRTFWNPAIESWAGTSWEPDERFRDTVEDTLPIGNIPYKAKYEAHFVGAQPCAQGDPKDQCVLLRTVQEPDPDAIKEMVKRMITMLGGKAEDISSIDLHILTKTELLTRANSLVPVELSLEKHVVMKGVEKGKPFEQSRSERREWKFRCTRT